MEIKNGQVWKQKEFPFCERAILMFGFFEEGVGFMLLGGTPLNICTDREGKRLFTKEELIERFTNLQYTLDETAQTSISTDLSK